MQFEELVWSLSMFSGADTTAALRYYLAITMQYLTFTLFKKENNQNQEYFLKCFRGLI